MFPGSRAGSGDEPLVRGHKGRLFLVLSLGWVGIEISRQLLPPLLPTIIDDLAITPFQAGAALSVMWAMYALTHYPGGRFADRLSHKTVLIGGVLAIIIGLLFLGGAFSYLLLLIGVSIMGAAGGFYSVSTRAKTADLYVVRRAEAFGIQMSFSRMGGAAAAGVAVIILAIGTWRSAFIPIAIFMGFIAIGLHRLIREPYEFQRIELGIIETGSRVFGRPEIRYVLIAYVFWTFAMMGITGFLPTFLLVDKGFSPTGASAGFAVVYIVGIVVGPLAGVLGDRFAKLPVAAVSVSIAALGMVIMLLGTSLITISFGIVLVAIGIWAFPPVMQATLMDVFDDVSMAGDFGAVKTVWMILGSLGPSYVGFVAGLWSYSLGFWGLALMFIGCLGCIEIIRRS